MTRIDQIAHTILSHGHDELGGDKLEAATRCQQFGAFYSAGGRAGAGSNMTQVAALYYALARALLGIS